MMKNIGLVAVFVICCLNVAQAQDNNKKGNKYRTWITLIEEPYNVQGTLYQLKDSSLLVSDYITFSEYMVNDNPTIELHIANIDFIETRKRNRIGKSVVIGAASGFALGGLLGLARGDDEDLTAEQKAIRGGISLAIPGALIGLLVGSVKVVIPLEGSLLNYKRQRHNLLKYSTKR